jgi:DNA replication protein DnaC
MEPIDEILKKMDGSTSKANLPISSTTEARSYGNAGDPDCPICHGVGFVSYDVPLGHPEFGKLHICKCRQAEVNQTYHQRLIRLSNLDALKNMTFESFNVNGRGGMGIDQANTLITARDLSIQFARSLQGWLLLMGGYGCGKTHLAAAIANFVVSLGIPTLFLTVPDLLDWLRFAYASADTSFEERFEEIRNIRLLVLDDLGTQNTTPWAQEKLFQIINHRYTNHLPTVITTNQDLKDIDGRINSRLQDPELVGKVKITAPDFRQATQDTTHPLLSTLHMHQSRTFGNFSLREREKLDPEKQKAFEVAFRAAHAFAEEPRGWLVLSGGYGSGKTHLAAAIGNYRHSLGESPVFVVVPDLLDHLRATFNPSSSVSYDELFEQIRSARLLILDDLGTQSATPWAREKLYQIFNYRYNAELPTVITTSDSLNDIDPRIRSRMMDKHLCESYILDLPSYRGGSTTMNGEKARRGRKPTVK